ncbi:hypothetical protein [Candidatus Regiella insecticola]|uniref:hypothetical protein n=1 Tax=Candidatus Regiella insecticola TaxID=138073 RepID=UPI0002D90DCE|nr:hypothetical protein [Candidatus Regiella insecticola]
MNFELRQGGQGDRPMSVDRLRDSANTRSQRRRNLKGEGYIAHYYNIELMLYRFIMKSSPGERSKNVRYCGAFTITVCLNRHVPFSFYSFNAGVGVFTGHYGNRLCVIRQADL